MREVSRPRDFILRFSNLIEHRGGDEERVFADRRPAVRRALAEGVDRLPGEFARASNGTLPNLWDRSAEGRAAMGR